MAQKITEILEEVRTELGADLHSMDVVGMDGISIAGMANVSNFDSSPACARFAMVMKLAAKVTDKLGTGTVESNMVTTEQGTVISRPLGDGSYFWTVNVVKDATLGTTLMVMNEYADQIWDSIPH